MTCYSTRKYSFYNNTDEVHYYTNTDIFKATWICISTYKLEIDMASKHLLSSAENPLYSCTGAVESPASLFALIVMR